MIQSLSAFTGEIIIKDYYLFALLQIRKNLLEMPDQKILANEAQELVDYYTTSWLLNEIEKDASRQVSPRQEVEVNDSMDPFVERTLYEVRYTILEYPLVPRASNANAVRIKATSWPEEQIDAKFQTSTDVVTLKAHSGDIERNLGIMERMIKNINQDIYSCRPDFLGQLWSLVKQRLSEVSKATRDFEEQMRKLGIEVTRKSDAIEPVNIEVKKEIKLLREPPANRVGPREPHLSHESVGQIVGLIDMAGKGFQIAPSVYSQLGEEDLRTIILGYLNAVFNSNIATGETFSKEGKSDILVNIPGGAVLIGECKFWGGSSLYQDTLDQLFRYMAWQHTIGIVVSFSKRKGLSNVVSEGNKAIVSHSTYRANSLDIKNSTYLVSIHEHPDDAAKSIEVHHLFFNLFSGRMKT
jgi:hypothetical protein